jgi:hypothetical protein
LKPAEGGGVAANNSLNLARVVHGQTARVKAWLTRKEKEKLDTWQNVIGWADFYPILSLNSIISLQINFLFFYFHTKIHDFFSLQIDICFI